MMLTEPEIGSEERMAQIEKQLQTSQRRNKRNGVLIAAILVALVLQSWLQMVRTDRLYDVINTCELVTARPPLASPTRQRPSL